MTPVETLLTVAGTVVAAGVPAALVYRAKMVEHRAALERAAREAAEARAAKAAEATAAEATGRYDVRKTEISSAEHLAQELLSKLMEAGRDCDRKIEILTKIREADQANCDRKLESQQAEIEVLKDALGTAAIEAAERRAAARRAMSGQHAAVPPDAKPSDPRDPPK